MDYEEIYNHVAPDNFGVKINIALPGADYGTDHVSNGILYASKDAEFVKQTSEAAKRFYNGDFGDMYEWNEHPIPGCEEGNYPSKFGDIRIKRESNRWLTGTIMFFPFER